MYSADLQYNKNFKFETIKLVFKGININLILLVNN